MDKNLKMWPRTDKKFEKRDMKRIHWVVVDISMHFT